jgi:uncharacterized protein (TIGR02145 family)
MKTSKLILIVLLPGLISLQSCKKIEKEMAVSTGMYQNVKATSAEVNGEIIDLGEGATQYGHCYSTSQNPTIALPTRTEKGTPVIGKYISTLNNLSPSTKYYVRAYISRGSAVAYGSEINFTTTAIITPGAPTNVVAEAGNAKATVTFTAPVSDGGSAITGYTATSSPGGLTGTGSASPVTVSGLTNGTAYTFTVTATNANGTGPASSASNSVTPSTSLTVPGAPTGVSATAGNAQATVTFVAPASDGGSAITGYKVTSSPSGFIGTGSSSPITVTGLTNGTAYTFTVVATNINGNSAASTASNSVTPSTVPSAPIIGTATKGNTQATITFSAPTSDGGSTITGYTVTSNPGSITGNGTASPITVTGLTNGIAYTFTVTATNANGTGPASAASNSVTPSTTVPGSPIIGSATKGNAVATVTFTAPISDGGSAITGYTATSNPGGFAGTSSSSPITVTGLTNGTAYTFTVTATNANGTGPASTTSNSVTPSTVPSAPTIGTATKGNTQATITFSAPTSDGGSAITGYTVTSSPSGFIGTGSSSPITVTGLTNGTAYTFTVTATNANGTGPASFASNSVTPSTVPGAPINVSATAGNTQASVTFSIPVSNGGSVITGYTVTSSPDNKTGTGPASPITVTGLTNGTAYTFTVTATNISGTGPESSASNSVTPSSTVPGAPINVSATAGSYKATVEFAAPVSDGGSVITEYTATSSPGSFTGTSCTSPIIVTGLTDGTAYTFTVTATNAIGTGPASLASNEVTPQTGINPPPLCPPTVPGPETITIGTQVWMAQNLNTSTYRDGTIIPNVTDPIFWSNLTCGAYCEYNNTPVNSCEYGKLYNWYAVVDARNICPTGWHIPSDAEWTTLETYLIANGYNYDGTTTGNKIAKALASTTLWTSSSNTGAIGNIDYSSKRNATGFTALPGGNRGIDGAFSYKGYNGYWWSATESNATVAWLRGMNYGNVDVSRYNYNKNNGFSIRCIKN